MKNIILSALAIFILMGCTAQGNALTEAKTKLDNCTSIRTLCMDNYCRVSCIEDNRTVLCSYHEAENFDPAESSCVLVKPINPWIGNFEY